MQREGSRRWGIRGVVVAVVGWSLACGGLIDEDLIAEEAAEALIGAAGVDVEKDGEGIRLKTGDGEITIGTESTLPDDFPFPAPPGWTPQMVANTGEGSMVTMQGGDAASARTWAREQITAKGCADPDEMKMGGQLVLSCDRGDGERYSITVAGEGSDATLSVIYTLSKGVP